MLRQTLVNMQRGGIHDHLGGGFARYSVDERWLVPHFEKMLYDNAQLAHVYLWAGIEFEEPGILRTARTHPRLPADGPRPGRGRHLLGGGCRLGGRRGSLLRLGATTSSCRSPAMRPNWPPAHFGVTEAGNFEGRNILNIDRSLSRTRRTVRQAGGRGRSSDRSRPPGPSRASRKAGSTRPRRQSGGGVERTGDPGPGRGRGRAWASSVTSRLPAGRPASSSTA